MSILCLHPFKSRTVKVWLLSKIQGSKYDFEDDNPARDNFCNWWQELINSSKTSFFQQIQSGVVFKKCISIKRESFYFHENKVAYLLHSFIWQTKSVRNNNCFLNTILSWAVRQIQVSQFTGLQYIKKSINLGFLQTQIFCSNGK